MSPSKFQDSDVTKGVINGPRPMPLRINKDSHVIQKPHPNPPAAAAAAAKPQPVIIYTHSPKVIHTQASDFMSLVQRLTGLKRDEDDGDAAAKAVKAEDSFSYEKESGVANNNVGYDENNETTSLLADHDQRFRNDVKQDSSTAVPTVYKMPNAYLIDAPLFTPNSNEFFCSSRPNSLFQSPNMAAAAANSISPSFMDYMKAFPDY